jgi:type II secretory pathway component GspD/PulD (secretin)
MRLFNSLFTATLGVLITLASISVSASPRWSTEPFSYFAENAELTDVLRSFASTENIPIKFSENVQGTVNGRFHQMAPAKFFDHLLKAYNLDWYYDGKILYVYQSEEIETDLINLNFFPVQRFRETLDQLGVLDSRFVFKTLEDEGIVFMSGPQPLINLVKDLAKALDASLVAGAKAQSRVVYRWVDEDDRHHYTTAPPPKGAQLVKTLNIQSNASTMNNLSKQVEDYSRYLEALRNPQTKTFTEIKQDEVDNNSASALVESKSP